MSPFPLPVILDNNCISNFHLAESLEFTLTLWPAGTFKIPRRVLDEAHAWREHGKEVCAILDKLKDSGAIEMVGIDDNSEEEVNAYTNLRLAAPVLGRGESESIAIAHSRSYIVATDDAVATERCKQVFPSIQVVTTARLFAMAKADGLILQSKVNKMWALIKSREKDR